MTWQRIALYYALCVVLGGYYYFFEWRPSGIDGTPIAASRKVPLSRFLPIHLKDVQEVTFRRTNGAVVVRREGEVWKVVEPQGGSVTSALITSFLETLSPDRDVEIIEENPTDLAPYGLAQPAATVVIKGTEKDAPATVYIGDHNPTSSAVYVRKENTPQVFLLGFNVKYYEDLIFQAVNATKQ
jgi:hypothetical protein